MKLRFESRWEQKREMRRRNEEEVEANELRGGKTKKQEGKGKKRGTAKEVEAKENKVI